MTKLVSILVFLALLVTAWPVWADLKVQIAKESELAPALSPQNPKNSMDISNNSVGSHRNSASNPDNSSSIPENDPTKAENGTNGNRRLLFEKDGVYYFIGYFVQGKDRLINFFSPFGKRLFYTPSGSDALFDSESGEFCGALAPVNGKTVLMLTEKGQTAMKKAGVPPFSPTDTNVRKSISGMYSDSGEDHRINSNNGSMIVLDDGSMWEIDPVDTMISAVWKYEASITVSNSHSGKYEYLLSNDDDNREVRANYLGKK